MPSKSSTSVPKSWVSWPLSALHIKDCTSLCYCLLSPDLRNTRDMSCMHLIYLWLLMVKSVIRTCHNKLNCTINLAWRASPRFKFDFGIVFRVDVLDNQGSSSFNFNSSFIRWRNWRIFFHTTTVLINHFDKHIIYQNTINNALNLIKWISVVPHQVSITTVFKIAWIRRFLGDFHIHTPYNRQP